MQKLSDRAFYVEPRHGLVTELRLMKVIGIDLQNRTEFPLRGMRTC